MAVILEDDLTVSPFFYKYLKLVHNKYDSRRDVSGFSLQGTSLRHSDGHCCLNVATENKVFLYPTLGTTGFSPKRDSWFMFKSWLNHITSNGQRPPLIKDHVAVTWYEDLRRLGHEESMWEMGYLYYTRMQGEYTLYPNFKDHQGLTVNWFEVGLHNKGKMEEDSNGKPENGLLRSWNPQYDQLPDEPIYVNNNGDVIS